MTYRVVVAPLPDGGRVVAVTVEADYMQVGESGRLFFRNHGQIVAYFREWIYATLVESTIKPNDAIQGDGA